MIKTNQESSGRIIIKSSSSSQRTNRQQQSRHCDCFFSSCWKRFGCLIIGFSFLNLRLLLLRSIQQDISHPATTTRTTRNFTIDDVIDVPSPLFYTVANLTSSSPMPAHKMKKKQRTKKETKSMAYNTMMTISKTYENSTVNHSAIVNKDFHWSYIDPSSEGICGFNKCFFRSSKSNKVGYLIAYNTQTCNLTAGWEMAIRLRKKYGIKHLYYKNEPPKQIDVSKDLVRYTQNEILPHVQKDFYKRVYINEFVNRLDDVEAKGVETTVPSSVTLQQRHRPTFQIQRVKVISATATTTKSNHKSNNPGGVVLEWGNNYYRNLKCHHEFNNFVRTSLRGRRHKLDFAEKLQNETKNLFEKVLDEESWLVHDFQILMDRYGNVYHIDLDRTPSKEFVNQSPARLEKSKKFILVALRVIAMKVIATIQINKEFEADAVDEHLLRLLSKAHKVVDDFNDTIC